MPVRGLKRVRAFGLLVVAGGLAVACGGSGASAGARDVAASDNATAAAKGIKLMQVGTFHAPIYLAGAPGDTHRLFVVEKAGRIIVVVNGHRRSRPFLDITHLVQSSANEQGLLGLAFAPDYQQSGRFYVAYTIANNDVRIAQYRRSGGNPGLASAGSARIVLTVSHRFDNHTGGQRAFGPDGDLYIGIGDGGSEDDPMNLGQNTSVLDGKILRISPGANGGYSIPAGNPFIGKPGRRPEIWAYGLRNPWRFSFDRATGDLAIGDVGQDKYEEIDFAPHGVGKRANYGWSIFEGRSRFKHGSAPGAVFPVLVAPHSAGYCAIIGGYVVRDHSLPSLYGRYLFGDDCKPQINSVKLSPGRARGNRSTGLSVHAMSSFGEDTAGHVYAVSLAGPVYRIAAR
ncbi:MAG: PQQ-dependent sugar dehydrogenase [Solirubrobacteraceae bacterium]